MRRRSCPTAGRNAYRHKRSKRSRAPARTAILACRSNPCRRACHSRWAVDAGAATATPHRLTDSPLIGRMKGLFPDITLPVRHWAHHPGADRAQEDTRKPSAEESIDCDRNRGKTDRSAPGFLSAAAHPHGIGVDIQGQRRLTLGAQRRHDLPVGRDPQAILPHRREPIVAPTPHRHPRPQPQSSHASHGCRRQSRQRRHLVSPRIRHINTITPVGHTVARQQAPYAPRQRHQQRRHVRRDRCPGSTCQRFTACAGLAMSIPTPRIRLKNSIVDG